MAEMGNMKGEEGMSGMRGMHTHMQSMMKGEW